eukprot:2353353-Rhodomonas_salina.1
MARRVQEIEASPCREVGLAREAGGTAREESQRSCVFVIRLEWRNGSGRPTMMKCSSLDLALLVHNFGARRQAGGAVQEKTCVREEGGAVQQRHV